MAEMQHNDPIHIPNKRKILSRFSLVRKLCIILIAVSFTVYANTLYNGFVLDDAMMIGENQFVKQGFSGIPSILTTPHLKGYMSGLTDTYRPLSLVMFAIEYQFFGGTPASGHLFNILVFIGTVLMLFIFLHKLFDKQRITLAFIAALLFAVHPIHTEVVASIKSRDELLCFFFGFLSLNIFIDYGKNGRLSHFILGTLSLFLSIISKETVVAFIGVIPLIFFIYKSENRKRSVFITIATFSVVAAYVLIRTIIINKYAAEGLNDLSLIDNPLLGAPTLTSRIATAMLILGRYLRLLFVPYPLIFDYSYNSIPYVGFDNIWVLLSLAVYLAIGLFSIYRLIKNKKDPLAFGILFFLSTIFLYSNIPFLIWGAQADRWLFFSSAGICLVIALAIEEWVLRSRNITILKSPKAAILFAICLVYACITINRNTDWKDEYTLYKTDIEKSPNNSKLNVFLGNELLKKYQENADPEQKARIKNDCIRYFKKALEIYPVNASAHAALGTAFMIDHEPDSAIVHFKRAIELDPDKLIALPNLGTLYSIQEKYVEAIPYYLKTVSLEPEDIVSWFNLAIVYMHIQKYDSAILAFNNTIAIDPAYSNYTAFANIAVVYKMYGKMDSARKYEAITKQYYPNFSIDSSMSK